MSGTDHSQDQGWTGPQPVFVLVRPQMGENIGAAARAMWNFGLDRLRLVDPRDGWPNPRAVAMATGAGQVLDHVEVVADTPAALVDMNYVFATTARNRDLTKPVVSPERAMEQARAMIAAGQKIAVMFGPERAGLENEDVIRANALISVPVNPAFGSLNLAQCVLLTAYEWRRQTQDVPPEFLRMQNAKMATGVEIEKLFQHYFERLDEKGFFWPDHKAAPMAQTLRNMFSRMPLTDADVRTMHGILRALTKTR
ncbi:MAG: RNA methyltransferase [Rhodobacter sp.]|jgi:tRNA/rRNA methyltransferase|nr:RNA methyltransferase [Rhodobacter sp.]